MQKKTEIFKHFENVSCDTQSQNFMLISQVYTFIGLSSIGLKILKFLRFKIHDNSEYKLPGTVDRTQKAFSSDEKCIHEVGIKYPFVSAF